MRGWTYEMPCFLVLIHRTAHCNGSRKAVERIPVSNVRFWPKKNFPLYLLFLDWKRIIYSCFKLNYWKLNYCTSIIKYTFKAWDVLSRVLWKKKTWLSIFYHVHLISNVICWFNPNINLTTQGHNLEQSFLTSKSLLRPYVKFSLEHVAHDWLQVLWNESTVDLDWSLKIYKLLVLL